MAEYVRWGGEWVEVGSGGITGPVTIDSFEDGDMVEYSGETSNFEVVSNTDFDGDYALENTSSGSGRTAIISTTGLGNYPSRGDTFRAEIQPIGEDSAAPGIVFGAVDTDNHYFARLSGQSAIEIYKRSGGGASLIDDDPFALTQGTTYTFEITWADDNTITFRLLDSSGSELASASGQDSEFSSESGFGWYNGTGSGHYYDYARVIA